MNHLVPGHPDNPKTFSICGAKTRQEESNPLCLRPAGAGTSHVGQGRCKLHGGNNLVGVDNPRYRNGRYAHVMKGRLAEHYRKVMDAAADGDPLDLLPELQALQAIFGLAIEQVMGRSVSIDKLSPEGGEDWHTIEGGSRGSMSLSTTRNFFESPETFFNLSQEDQWAALQGVLTQAEFWKDAYRGVQEKLEKGGHKLVKLKDLADLTAMAKEITNTAGGIVKARNETALTVAELMYIKSRIRVELEQFIPEKEKRVKFLEAVFTGLPD